MNGGGRRCLSLFSGCGGLDLGFHQAGFSTVQAIDVDRDATATYARNLCAPVVTANVASSPGVVDAFRDKIDVVLAGPPCQGFSTAGRRDLTDKRNALLLDAAHIAAEIQPSVVVIENVAGAIQGAHAGLWNRASAILRDSGFRTETLCLDLSRLGVPQHRKRVFLLAWRSTWHGGVGPELEAPVSLKEALATVDCASSHRTRQFEVGSRTRLISQAVGPGQKLSNVRAGDRAVHTWDIPKVFGEVTGDERVLLEALLHLRRRARERNWGDADPVHARRLQRHLGRPVTPLLRSLCRKNYVRRVEDRYDLCNTFNGRYRRPHLDGPSPTVDTKFVQARYFLHPTEHRGFSAREAARLQTFPDTFVLPDADRTAARLIGNAVPPRAALVIGSIVRDRLAIA